MTDALRVAVAGTGAFGRNHLRVYREMAGVTLVAAIEPEDGLAAEVAACSACSALTQNQNQE